MSGTTIVFGIDTEIMGYMTKGEVTNNDCYAGWSVDISKEDYPINVLKYLHENTQNKSLFRKEFYTIKNDRICFRITKEATVSKGKCFYIDNGQGKNGSIRLIRNELCIHGFELTHEFELTLTDIELYSLRSILNDMLSSSS